MRAAKRAAAESIPLARARISLALMGAATVGFSVAAMLGADAAGRRDAALARAVLYANERPYLAAPLEVVLRRPDADEPGVVPSPPSAREIEREQAELDAIVAEAAAAERALPAHRVGLGGTGGVSGSRLALHGLVHAGWLHLLWNLGLLASAGAHLELRLGRALYGALLLAASAAGAALHVAASGPAAAPLVGLSAATAGIVGALAIRPGDAVARDPLAPARARPKRSPIRVAAGVGAGVCAISAVLGASSLGFAPLALLGGLGLGAAAMFGLARTGRLRNEGAGQPGPEVARALALLEAGDVPAALESLKERLSAADDPLAARALGLALRGRADASEALAQALSSAIEGERRESAIATWRALSQIGGMPRGASAPLRTLATWLRGAGAQGEARVVALASLEGADARTMTQIAKDARRADPVLALRAAELALAQPMLGELEQKALQELAAQARKDAGQAGVVVLDAQAEAQGAQQRAVSEPAVDVEPRGDESSQRARLDVSDLAGDDGALDLETLGGASEAPPDNRLEDAPESDMARDPEEPAAGGFFERGAVDLTAEEPAVPEPQDPPSGADDALLDALHEALVGDAELAREGVSAEAADSAIAAAGESPLATSALAEATPPGEATGPRALHAKPADPARLIATPPSRPAPRAEDFAFGEAGDECPGEEKGDPAQAALRPLRVSSATPQRFGSEALVLQLEGRGRAKLAYAKVDAVAAAGVKRMSESGKPVLLIDLVIGSATGAGELRVVRLRADGFDPRRLVPGHTSPLVALRAFVAELRARTRATALPAPGEPSAPFRIYPDLATYEREVLGAAPR